MEPGPFRHVALQSDHSLHSEYLQSFGTPLQKTIPLPATSLPFVAHSLSNWVVWRFVAMQDKKSTALPLQVSLMRWHFALQASGLTLSVLGVTASQL